MPSRGMEARYADPANEQGSRTPQRMRVGLIIYGSLETVSGGYIFDRMLASELQRQGDTVEVISLQRRSFLGNLIDNFYLRMPGGFDVILQDELNHPSLLVANAARRAFPVVSIVHNLRSSERRPSWQNRLHRSIERVYLNSVDGLVFNSETTRDSVMPLLAGSKPYVVAQPGGDRLGTLEPEHVRQRALRPGPLRLLFLANVTTGKGLEVVLDALSCLPASDFTLDVVGSTDVEASYAERMRRRARQGGLQVSFRGVLDQQALSDRLSAADVLVLPSFYEGFGIAYLEGMAHGLLALGTTAGAIPELIDDGVNGYLISPGDVATLARRLSELAGNRDLRVRMGLAALQTFKSRPTWIQSGQAIRNFLLEMVARSSSAKS